MNPPVRADYLAQAVHIGGFQLGQLAVLQNAVDNGVLALELFQHVGLGGVAGFGLFYRGKTQFIKQNPP